ncbi:hypothetical protein KP509_12G068900 [Ceratopteris richardii]|uniref:Glyoxalase/fosfomycin resistance/dioxygenase domain-containing protein n=1 Tax=Ceratopteris richardii TaxID=49495 RepID=A0A8T2TMR5_CERRI|nr:hypothetical protein KP509_12G068900 [Ceratopteris richardii]KAH7423690.1 hypothetical protein KP509_12G068900 [Ceratopteris richardii]
MALLRYMVMLHKDVPRAAKFFHDGLGLTVRVCTHRWAELQSGPITLGLMQAPSDFEPVKNYSSYLSFDVEDLNSTITKLLSMGAELDGPIKHEIHGKVAAVRCLDGHMLGLYEPV